MLGRGFSDNQAFKSQVNTDSNIHIAIIYQVLPERAIFADIHFILDTHAKQAFHLVQCLN